MGGRAFTGIRSFRAVIIISRGSLNGCFFRCGRARFRLAPRLRIGFAIRRGSNREAFDVANDIDART